MSTEKWQRINDLFQAALEVEPSHRPQFLQNQCDDPLVVEEVKLLLSAHQEAGSFIQTPVSILQDTQEDDDLIAPGERIGVYKIVKEIGRGGMGAVYLASRADDAYEKHVAVKVLKQGIDSAEIVRHFRNERQILADFDHPNIARLLDGGTTHSGVPYFVMEYVEGMPVDLYCNHHRLTITQRLELFQQICAAVSYAHRHLVIHRDIKPSNVLVTTDGVPKLLDFGIAKILHPNNEARSTATGIHLMTPEYASPEQILGRPVTTVSDVYSLGVLLYELVAGRLPYRFTGRSPIEIARTIHDTQPLLPSVIVDRIDPEEKITPANVSQDRNVSVDQLKRRLRGDLDNIISMAIRKEPERRYQSVEQFSEDIRRHLVRLPVLARKDTIGYRVTKFAKRNPLAVTAAAIAFVTLLAGAITTSWQAQKARAEQTRAEYAREFADELRYIESLLLSTYTAPLHDTRPSLKMASARLKKMEQRMINGGESAFGSGHNAIGNGYLMLKDFERAKLHLEKAWNSGYQEPSTAYALGKALGILYQQSVTNADRVSNAHMKRQQIRDAEIKYAEPAIRLLKKAHRFAESPAYVEGLIALYQNRFDEALRKTSEALKYSSRPYEVMKLEGDIHFAMGRAAMDKGNQSSGLSSYELAGNAYSKAADSARSDPDIYLADAKRITRVISAQPTDATKWIDAALIACDKAVSINPDSDLPYIYKSEVYAQQGINEMYHTAKDPRPAYRLSIQQAGEAIRRRQSSDSHNGASQAYFRIAEYELATNFDPRDALNKSIEEAQQAIRLDPHYKEGHFSLATAHFLTSEYELIHGQDSSTSLRKVIEIYDKELRSVPKDAYAYNLLALSHLGLGEYKLKRGGDPRQEFQMAIALYDEGLRNDPVAAHLHEGLGLAYVDVAKYEINNGMYPEKSFDEAIRAYNKSLDITPKIWGIFNRGVAYLTRAEYKFRTTQDPKADILRAENDFQKALELIPDLSPAVLQRAAVHLLKARLLFKNGENPAPELNLAKTILNQHKKLDPASAEASLIEGQIHTLFGRWSMKKQQNPSLFFDQAITRIQKSIELNPNEVMAYLELASAYRYGADWLLHNGQPANEWIERGLQKTMEAEKIKPDQFEILALRSTLLKLKSRVSNDAVLAQEASNLLHKAMEKNAFLKAEYEN
jgi:serine/threonine protein kinase